VRIDALSTLIVLLTAYITLAIIVGPKNPSPSDMQDRVSLGALAITYGMAISGAMGFLSVMMADLESSFSSVERIREYCSGLPREKEVEYGNGNDPDHPPAPRPTWPEAGKIEFKDVSLRYRDGLPLVLRKVNFTAEAGKKIGVVGRTGSGKSTIMLSLFRMVELASGTIAIDGQDISQLKMEDLRTKVTIIPQDPLLFQGTVRSNLDPFNQYLDDVLWEAIDAVNLRERVASTKKGLLAEVSERGANFSVGQRQLLCLARAILKRSKILLLDEATASVDFESDALLQSTIRTSFKACTVMTIAHRLATIIDSDKVLVLDSGEVREFDHPANLLRNPSTVFHGMVQALGDEQFALLKTAAEQALKASSIPQ
jgi:ABC-type multidrug transport system fused ATPase/permease subunit